VTIYIVNVEGAVLHEGRYLMIVRGAEESHAAGTLALVGGKVETAENQEDVLETTLRREIWEEVGIVVGEIAYVQSTHFIADDGDQVIDIVFLCQYEYGEPVIDNPGEVAEFLWLTAKEILKHPKAPEWTRNSIKRVEAVRRQLGW
jgi:8-oxo-dGTP pyrophosphatase MutT (NUDIX family)